MKKGMKYDEFSSQTIDYFDTMWVQNEKKRWTYQRKHLDSWTSNNLYNLYNKNVKEPKSIMPRRLKFIKKVWCIDY